MNLTNSAIGGYGYIKKRHCLVTKTLRVMQLTAIILLSACLVSHAAGFSQKVSISVKNEPVQKVFKEVSRQTGLSFIYNEKIFEDFPKVTIDVKSVTINEFLQRVLKGNYDYHVKDGLIIVKRTSALTLNPALSRQIVGPDLVPPIKISGIIVGVNSQPLVGATIRVKGKNINTLSDDKGHFQLEVEEGSVLIISYVGFEQRTYKVDSNNILSITLVPTNNILDTTEVVFSTGYQNIPKERATGSFVQIDNKTINRSVGPNILDRILNVTSSLNDESNGTLGNEGSRISIRGFSTINANKMPLIVIDGFPYNEGSGTESFIKLNRLNPSDVDNITILRDAAAASIWGARSGNGVIVITTKKGKYNQNTNVQLSVNMNIIERPRLSEGKIISSVDAIEFEKKLFSTGVFNDYDDLYPSLNRFPIVSPVIEVLLSARRNEITQAEADAQLIQFMNHDVRDDISKYLLRTSINQQYNLNISGGSNRMKYYGSIGYDKNPSSAIGNEANRITLRFDNTYRPIKNLEINTYISFAKSSVLNNGIDYKLYLADGSSQIAPYTMLADIDGNPLHVGGNTAVLRSKYIDTIQTNGLQDWHYRPLDEIRNSNNVNNQFNTKLGAGLRYNFQNGLSAEVSGQYDHTWINIENYFNSQSYYVRNLVNQFMFTGPLGQPQYPVPLGGILNYSVGEQIAYDFRGKVSFNRAFGGHDFFGIAGMDVRESQYHTNDSRKYGYDPVTLSYASNMSYNTLYDVRPSGTALIGDGNNLNGTLNRYLSYFTNIGYTLLNKYTFNWSARVDASNFFGIDANLKSVPLWSIGTSWNIKKEIFSISKFISALKMRATYGFNGNLDNSATALPTILFASGYSQYNSQQEYAFRQSPPNPGLTWEKIQISNLGLDFGFLGNRVMGSIDAYFKNGRNLIGQLLSDPTTGVLDYVGNYASTKSKGIDVVLNGLILNGMLKWVANLSLSYNANKVTDYYLTSANLVDGNRYVAGQLMIGKPQFSIYSYKWAGLDPQTGNPMGIVNGNIVPFTTVLGRTSGVPNTKPQDLIYHGSATPKTFGNILNSFSFHGVTVSCNIVYALGHFFRAASIDYNALRSRWGGHSDYTRRWQKPGDELITTVPSMPVSADNRYSFYSRSSILVERADYVRLQDIRLAFDLKSFVTKLPAKDIAFFVTINNLGLIWVANNKDIDPKFNDRIPESRTIAFGLTINY